MQNLKVDVVLLKKNMQKISPEFFEGIAFVQLYSLPLRQHEAICSWLSADSYHKFSLPDKVMDDCILYDEYEYWFEYAFQYHDYTDLPFALDF